MAFTEQEKQLANTLKNEYGASNDVIKQRITELRTTNRTQRTQQVQQDLERAEQSNLMDFSAPDPFKAMSPDFQPNAAGKLIGQTIQAPIEATKRVFSPQSRQRQAFQQAGKNISEGNILEKGKGALQSAGSLVSGAVDIAVSPFSPVLGTGATAIDSVLQEIPVVAPAYGWSKEQVAEKAVDVMEWYERQDADTKANLVVLEAGLEGLTGGQAGKVGQALKAQALRSIRQGVPVAKAMTQYTKEAMALVKPAVKEAKKKTFAQVRKVADVLPKRTPDTTPKTVETPVKLTAKEIDLGITDAEKTAAQGSGGLIKEYVDEGLKSWKDPNAGGIYGVGVKRVQGAMEDVRKSLSDTGSELGKIREQFISKKATPELTKRVENKFNTELEKLGYVIKDGELEQIAGRGLKLSTGEQKLILDLNTQLDELSLDPNLQRYLDSRMNLDAEIDFGKKEGFVSNKLQNLERGVRSEYKKVIDTTFPEQKLLSDEYVDILRVLEDFDKASAKGNNIEYLLDRAFGTRREKARKAFEGIKRLTGHDLMKEAGALRLASAVVNPNQASRLTQAVQNAGLNVLSFVSPKMGLVKMAKETGEAVSGAVKKRKGIDPRFEEAVRKADILKGLDASDIATKPPETSVLPTTKGKTPPVQKQQVQKKSPVNTQESQETPSTPKKVSTAKQKDLKKSSRYDELSSKSNLSLKETNEFEKLIVEKYPLFKNSKNKIETESILFNALDEYKKASPKRKKEMISIVERNLKERAEIEPNSSFVLSGKQFLKEIKANN